MDIQKEREAFQNFCEQNFDVERHEQTYFDEQTQSYENDLGECTESINMAWSAWQAKAQAVPEGFVLVEKVKLMQIIGSVSLIEPITRGNPYMDSVKRELTAITDVVKTAIEALEPANEL